MDVAHTASNLMNRASIDYARQEFRGSYEDVLTAHHVKHPSRLGCRVYTVEVEHECCRW